MKFCLNDVGVVFCITIVKVCDLASQLLLIVWELMTARYSEVLHHRWRYKKWSDVVNKLENNIRFDVHGIVVLVILLAAVPQRRSIIFSLTFEIDENVLCQRSRSVSFKMTWNEGSVLEVYTTDLQFGSFQNICQANNFYVPWGRELKLFEKWRRHSLCVEAGQGNVGGISFMMNLTSAHYLYVH